MKKTYKALLFALISAILCAALSSFVSAEREPYQYSGIRDKIKDYDGVFFQLYDNVIHGAEIVDITKYRVQEKYLVNLFDDLLSSSPELYYLNSRLTYSYTNVSGTNYVLRVKFSYNMTPKEMKEARKIYDREIKYIASLVDPSLSEVEKALWVYDYMIALYGYDNDKIVYDAYRMMTGEEGVCRAYCLAYAAVLRELGMECIMVTSNEMVHAWNLVRIDGNWYHVDLTFDDPLNDRPGRTNHEYFLLSDEEISNREKGAHYNWNTSIVCDKSYSGPRFWDATHARMIYMGDAWYYIDTESKTLKCISADSGETHDIYTFENRWYTGENKRNSWVGVFSGLSEYDGQLVINTNDKIIAIDPKAKKQTVLFTVSENQQICGSAVHKDEIKYYVTFNPGGGDDAHVERLTLTEEIWNGKTEENDTQKAALPFTDVSQNSKYYNSIEYVYTKGLFNGVSDTKFAPDQTLTRAMFVTVLGRLCGVDTEKYKTGRFTDVPDGQWYTAYVEWAAENGIVNGVGDGKFDPSGELTREQMAKIAASCATLLTEFDAAIQIELPFSDRDSVSSWASDSVMFCINHGLIDSSTGKFEPQSKATRAEAADIIARLAEMINNSDKI